MRINPIKIGKKPIDNILHGGSWSSCKEFTRIAFRFLDSPFIRISYFGLRITLKKVRK